MKIYLLPLLIHADNNSGIRMVGEIDGERFQNGFESVIKINVKGLQFRLNQSKDVPERYGFMSNEAARLDNGKVWSIFSRSNNVDLRSVIQLTNTNQFYLRFTIAS